MSLPSPASDTCLIYLLRHGATANNLAKPARLQGCGANPELSDQGRAQAAAAAEALAEYSIRGVYASPLLRAFQTAEIIAERHQLTAQQHEGLLEVNVGNWEGRDWGEIERSEPEAYRNYMSDPSTYPYAGGETFGEVAERVVPAIDSLLAENLGSALVLVAHNVVNRCYLASKLNVPLAKARQIVQSNCGINVIRRSGDTTSVRTLNANFHLGELEST